MNGIDYIKDIRARIGNALLMVPGVAAVIVDEKNRLLLQEKAGEPWSLPAGMIDPGETPKQAVIREVREETGLIVKPNKILGLFGGRDFRYIYPNGDSVEYQIVLFKCSITDDIGKISDTETVRTQYFCKQDMPDLALPYPTAVLFNDQSTPYF